MKWIDVACEWRKTFPSLHAINFGDGILLRAVSTVTENETISFIRGLEILSNGEIIERRG